MLAKLFYGLIPTNLRQIALRYAELNYNLNKFNKETELAKKDQFYGFLKRNLEIKLKQPET